MLFSNSKIFSNFQNKQTALSKRQLKQTRKRQKQFNRIVTSQNKQLLNSPHRLHATSQLPTYPQWRKIPRFERGDDVSMMRDDLSFYLKPLDICLSFHRTDSLLKLCDKLRWFVLTFFSFGFFYF